MTGLSPPLSNVKTAVYLARLVGLAAIYAALGKLGMTMGGDNAQITLIWAPSGLATALLLHWGRTYWPGVFLGAVSVSLWLSTPVWSTLLIGAGNTAEALVAVFLLERLGFKKTLKRRRDVGFLLAAALAASTVAATIGAFALITAGTLKNPVFSWLGWWLGDVCSILLIAPFIFYITSREKDPNKRVPHLHLLPLWVAALVVSLPTFFQGGIYHLPLAFLPIPFVFFAAFRHGGLGASVVALLVSAVAVIGTAWDLGPFANISEPASFFLVWGYISMNALIALFVSAIMAELQTAVDNLSMSEHRYRLVVEGRESMIALMDAKFNIVDTNCPLEALLGANRSNSCLFTDTVPEDERDSVLRTLQAWQQDGDNPLELEARHLDQEGHLRHLAWSILREEKDGRTVYHGFGRDYSEHRRAEDLFRDMISSAPDTVLILDQDTRIVHANRAGEQLFGYSHDSLTGLSFSTLFPAHFGGTDRQRLEALLAKPARELLTGRFELTARRHNEETVPVEVRFGNFDGLEGPRISCFIRDLTRRKEEEDRRLGLEAKMRDAQKLESLGLLAGGIAHDFNNLLMGILGNAGIVLEDMSADNEHRLYLERIQTAAMRSGELTRQLLAYAGKGTFVVEPLRLSSLVEEMTHLLRISVSPGASLEMVLDEKLPAIDADATQLRQVLMNLITNASDSLHNGRGTIMVQTDLRRFEKDELELSFLGDTLTPGDFIVLEVSDNGCGMDEDTCRKIFDPFFTTKLTGRGLGLASVQGIVKGHGGAIQLVSQIGQGTTFRLLFPPYRKKTDFTPDRETQMKVWQGHGKVLVIDDEEFVLHFSRETLQRSGFEVILGGNGQEGIDRFQEHHQDLRLVLLDMTMPDKSGEEVFDQLHIIDPSVPVILSSGHSEQEARSHFTDRQLAGYLQKPYGIKTLKTLLREILE